MSIAAYAAGFLIAWLVMVLTLGFALKHCLASGHPTDGA